MTETVPTRRPSASTGPSPEFHDHDSKTRPGDERHSAKPS
jgi:hypothetical protein